MEPKDLLDLVNANGEATFEYDSFVPPERFYTTQLRAIWDGHSVTLKFTETDSVNQAYRFNVSVYDTETAEIVATGNGAEDWETAFATVHWNELKRHHWGKD
jgi:hypothetical protein